jgi:hypothetical protein
LSSCGAGTVASKSRSHSASGLETMSLPPPENSISSHGVPSGQPSRNWRAINWRCSTPSM